MYIPIIYNFFPNAKIIHCTRDPLDNILSIYRTNFLNHTFSNSLIDISKLYVYQTKLMHIYRKEYGSIIYSYQHNNVVLNPYETIFDLINWLDWNWDDKYLSPNLSNRNVYTASSAQVREKITSKSLGKWKGYKELLTPAVEILSQNNLI